jgi:hypothetical protein
MHIRGMETPMSNSNSAAWRRPASQRSPFVAHILDFLDRGDRLTLGGENDGGSVPDAAVYEIGFACGAEYAARHRSDLCPFRLAALRAQLQLHGDEFFNVIPNAKSLLRMAVCPASSENNAAGFFSRCLRDRLVNEVHADRPRLLRGFADGVLALWQAETSHVAHCSGFGVRSLDLT